MLDHCRTALFLLLVSSPSFAQTPCYAENDGNTFHDTTHMGGPNLVLAIKFTAPASVSVTRMEVFTGEGSGNNSLSIWSHDAANNRPLAQVSGQGGWALDTVNSWQGGNLSPAFALTGGNTYWLAWKCIHLSQASIEPPSAVVGQPYCSSFDSGTNWAGPFQDTANNWKFRLFCGTAGGSVTPFCFGDGTQAACPCANNGTAGRGCQNSASTGGAHLAWTGTSSPDTLVLTSSGERATAVSIFYQAVTSIPAATFGDGIGCLGGFLKKLFIKHATGGVATAPGLGDRTISQRSATLGDPLTTGSTRYYQVVYRDGNASFCPRPTGSAFNVSNGLTVVW